VSEVMKVFRRALSENFEKETARKKCLFRRSDYKQLQNADCSEKIYRLDFYNGTILKQPGGYDGLDTSRD
jgi:hypothetical protein